MASDSDPPRSPSGRSRRKLNTRARCGNCDACNRKDCGECTECYKKKKFGGDGSSKQSCLHRRCQNLQQRRNRPGIPFRLYSQEIPRSPNRLGSPPPSGPSNGVPPALPAQPNNNGFHNPDFDWADPRKTRPRSLLDADMPRFRRDQRYRNREAEMSADDAETPKKMYGLPVPVKQLGVCAECQNEKSPHVQPGEENEDDEDGESSGNIVILCDGEGCGREYHLACCKPPLATVPEGSFFCFDCSPEGATEQLRSYLDLFEENKAEMVDEGLIDVEPIDSDDEIICDANDDMVRHSDFLVKRDLQRLFEHSEAEASENGQGVNDAEEDQPNDWDDSIYKKKWKKRKRPVRLRMPISELHLRHIENYRRYKERKRRAKIKASEASSTNKYTKDNNGKNSLSSAKNVDVETKRTSDLTEKNDDDAPNDHIKTDREYEPSIAGENDDDLEDLFLGSPARMYCPTGNDYHNGRIIDVRPMPYDTLCLIRFPAGMDYRKTALSRWLYLEEHCVAIGTKMIWTCFRNGPTPKKQMAKLKSLSPPFKRLLSLEDWAPGLIWSRTARELVPILDLASEDKGEIQTRLIDVEDHSTKRRSSSGRSPSSSVYLALKSADPHPPSVVLVEKIDSGGTYRLSEIQGPNVVDSLPIVPLEESLKDDETAFVDTSTEPPDLKTSIQMACVEWAEKLQVRMWKNGFSALDPMHVAAGGRGKYQQDLGTLEFADVHPKPSSIELASCIPMGLDRAYIAGMVSDQLDVPLTKDLTASLSCEIVDDFSAYVRSTHKHGAHIKIETL